MKQIMRILVFLIEHQTARSAQMTSPPRRTVCKAGLRFGYLRDFSLPRSTLTVFALACVVFASSGWALSQEPASNAAETKKPDITAEQVLDKYIDAVGGRQAYEKITSMVGKGTMELVAQGIKGDMEFYAKVPNKYLEVGTIEGLGLIKQAYDGQVGWSEDPFQGLREMDGVELANLKRESTFHSELKWRELFEKVELIGTQKVGDRDTHMVRLTPGMGSPVTRYYDTETFLMLRQDSVQEGPQGEVPIEEYPSDYREVNGVKIPFQLTQKTPIGEAVVKLTEIKINVEIDNAMFAKPAGEGK